MLLCGLRLVLSYLKPKTWPNPLARWCARTLVRSRQADQLDGWINAARDSGIAIWTRFAASLKSDYDAVLNALKLPWSNGPVEGNVQRLKLIKRQAYGRANLDLLKARMMQPA